MPTFAVVDVGTHSVKLLVAAREDPGRWRTLRDRSEITRLGDGLPPTGGPLRGDAMERTLAAFATLVAEARELGAEGIAAAGTQGLRIASNQAEFLQEAKRLTGIDIDVVSGVDESRLAYLAVRSGGIDPDGTRVVFDTGGGSSQFTFGHGPIVDAQFSLAVGALRITETFRLADPVSNEGIQRVLGALSYELSRLDGTPPPSAVVGVGGAVTTLASVRHALPVYDPDLIQGTVLDTAEIDRQIKLYRTRSAAERRGIPGLQPRRAEVILAGACIVRTVLAKLGSDRVQVSDRGLRHGLLAIRFGSV